MTTTLVYFIFIPLLSIILLSINLTFAPHNAYQEKNSAFECGFHSFLGQNRTQFSISFFIFALLFLLFDLEILLVYPYSVSAYTNDIYGLITMLMFFLVLTLGFAFEWGKNALNLDTRQLFSVLRKILLSTIVRKCIIFLYKIYNTLLYIVVFILIYFMCSLFLCFLYANNIINIPFSDFDHYIFEPLYMNPPNTQPLDHYPEYKQVHNLQDIFNIQQHLLNVKRDLEFKLAFNKPECYKEIVDGLQRCYDNNKVFLDDPSKLHPHVSPTHQTSWLKDLEKQIQSAKVEYNEKLELFQINSRNYAECNHRITAVSTRVNQLRGFNT